MSIVIRAPRLSDVERLAVVNVEAWQHAYAGLVVQQRLDAMGLDEYHARWRSNITDPHDERIFLVAEVLGVVAAYAISGPYRPQDETDETPDTAGLGEVYALYAHPTMQGRGVGRALHDELLARLARQGYADLALWVLRDNERGRAWYERQGWRTDGATSDWVAHEVAHPEVRMRRRTPDRASGALLGQDDGDGDSLV